ncbi:hypothetical protein SDC9_205507 [bioreactor metagenome]|uniref:DUF3168 domain-containing protein n=1 Tax=bioreactor metagenome TaxID=1076179 RepID=A0A645JE33_9ZZZZ
MQAIKDLLNLIGLPVREERFPGIMPLPAIVYSDEVDVGGADLLNNIITHTITVELYAECIDSEAEAKIERLLDLIPIHYTRTRTWLGTEKMFQTVYAFTITERK